MSSIPDGWVKCPPHEAERFFDEVNGVLREFTETDFQYIVRVGIDVEAKEWKWDWKSINNSLISMINAGKLNLAIEEARKEKAK